jgi:hypothetical protein
MVPGLAKAKKSGTSQTSHANDCAVVGILSERAHGKCFIFSGVLEVTLKSLHDAGFLSNQKQIGNSIPALIN